MNVVWNKKAGKQWKNIAAYLAKEFGKKAVLRFAKEVTQCHRNLAHFPQMGQVEPCIQGRKYEYRSVVIHKHCKLVYYIIPDRQTIRIAALWDTRREPGALKGQV